MRTPNKIAYWTKTRALLTASLVLWLVFAITCFVYFIPDEPVVLLADGLLEDTLVSSTGGYLLFCGLFFAASLLISWFCGAQDRLDTEARTYRRKSGSAL